MQGGKSNKKVIVRLRIQAGKANPAPPIGPALGPRGVNMPKFCKEFNDKTASIKEPNVFIKTSVFINPLDKSFSFELKGSATSDIIKSVTGIASGSKKPGLEIVGSITLDQVNEVIKRKYDDFSGSDIEAKRKTVIGTARSMGIVFVN